MNRENINLTIAAIQRAEDRQFNMDHFISTARDGRGGYRWGFSEKEKNTCGTSACIAGWAHITATQLNDYKDKDWRHRDAQDDAKKFLGLDAATAQHLFYARGRAGLGGGLLNLTRAQAIRTLEILRDEGVVDWTRAIHEVAQNKPHKTSDEELQKRAQAAVNGINASVCATNQPVTTLPAPERLTR